MIKMLNFYCFLLLLFYGSLLFANDIGSSKTGSGNLDICAADLQDLQLVVRDATNLASLANEKHDHSEHCSEESSHKDIGVGDCDDIAQAYQDGLIDLDTELKNIENQLKLVQRSCGYDFVLSNNGSTK